jgi:hypothetical protein
MRQQELTRVLHTPFGFGGIGHDQHALSQLSVICGRATTWPPPPRSAEDDDFEPTIVRGRE